MSSETLTDALQDTFAVFEEPGEPWTTPEVTERLDCSRRTTYARLEQLVEQDRLETKKVGANARVWWRPVAETASDADRTEFNRLVEAVEEYAIFTLDPEGYVQTWNPGAEQINGYEADEILGKHFSAFYTDEDVAADVPAKNLSGAAAHGSVTDEGWRVRADGSRFWAHVTITAIRDEDGTLAGYTKVTREITERHEYEEQLGEQRDYTRQLLDTAPVGVLIVERNGTFTTANQQATELLELEENDDGDLLVGVKAVYDEDGEFLPPSERPYIRAFETGESIRNWHAQLELTDGRHRWLSTNIEPMTDEDGNVERVLVTIQDISALKEQARHLERQRDELENELDQIFERISDGFYALDGDFRFRYLNDNAADVLGLDESVLSQNILDVVTTTEQFEQALHEARDTQESVVFEEYYDPADRWFYNAIYPSEDGLSVYFRDITERKQRKRKLEESERRYRTLVENFPNGSVGLFDEELRYTTVGGALMERLGVNSEDRVGQRISEVHSDEMVNQIEPHFQAAIEGESQSFDVEYLDQHLQIQTLPVRDADDDVFAGMLVVQDITERKEREEELERTLDLLSTTERTADVGGWEIDTDTMDVFWTDHLFDLLEVPYDEEPPLDEALDIYVEEDRQIVESAVDAALETGEPFDVQARFRTADGEVRWLKVQGVPETEGKGEIVTLRGAAQDITERKERERSLRETKSQLEAATEAGEIATWEWYIPEDRMITGPWFAETFGVDPEVAREGEPFETFFSAVHEADQERVRAAVEETLSTCGEYEAEYRVWNADDELRWVVARGSVECDEDGTPLTFHGAVMDITDRKQSELELERQREELLALDNINEVVSEIMTAVIDQSTRREIEQTVCDALAAADVYEFAWFAEVDVETDLFEPRATAGTEGYAEEITVSVDPDDPGSQGPGATAVREQETQVIQNVFTDPYFEPWRDAAREYGFTAVAAIPVVHGETVYGVLAVYADRENAFDTSERAVISQLGEVVGHAIAAAERKEALMSDEVVELEFQIDNVFETVGTPTETDERITLDYAVPIGNDEFLVYGTATPAAIDSVRELVETVPYWEEITVRSQGEPVHFELRVTQPPLLSVVTDHGGYFESFVIEDGDCRMAIRLAPSVDVYRVIDAVEDAYPSARLMRRQQLTRPNDDPQRIQGHLVADLTDRQRAALDAAYHAGYFELPRQTDGAEIAESLGIKGPTFNHHLRKAQQKVFETLYSSREELSG